MIIRNGLVFTGEGRFVALDVALAGDKIAELAPAGSLPGEEGIDAAGGYVLPGFVDIHTHGAAGSDFCDADAKGLETMLAYYGSQGITSVVPATMSLSEALLADVIRNALPYFEKPGYGGVLRGINMEGPFVNMEKKGGQNPAYLIDPDVGMFQRLQDLSGGRIKFVDTAPELPGSLEFIRQVKGQCVISLAHTTANYEQAAAAFDAGASHVTHLFNAMSPFTGREPGVVGAASDKAAFVEMIADGIHLHPAVVRAVFRLFGAERICLISDSMRAAGMPDGAYDLGGQQVYMKAGKATLADGTIAGSTVNVAECCRRAVGFGVPLEQAVLAATLSPARAAGIDGIVGSLAPGKNADVLVWNRQLQPQRVLVAGEVFPS